MNRTKSVTAAAALAMICLGTGTAHAASVLDTTSDAAGVTVHITSAGSEGSNCQYLWIGVFQATSVSVC